MENSISMTEATVLLDLPVRDFRDALEQLLRRIMPELDAAGLDGLLRALLAREQLGSTILGSQIAVPHVRVRDLGDARCGFIRVAQTVDNLQGEAVRAMFLVLVDEQRPADHLAILARVAQGIQGESSLELLLESNDSQSIIQICAET